MKTEILQAVQDWLGPIREQMEQNRKAMLTSMMPGTATHSIGGLGDLLMQNLVAPTLPGADVDPAQLQQDLQTRGLLTRIKNADISRGQRDSLSSTVRILAADGRLGEKAMRKLYEMIALMENVGPAREKKAFFSLGEQEKTVDHEMEWIYERRAQQKAQDERINSLESAFSMYA